MEIGVFVSEVGVREGYEHNVSGHLQIAMHSCQCLVDAGHKVHLIGTMQEGFRLPFCMPENVEFHTVRDGKRRGEFGWDSLRRGYRWIGVLRQIKDIRSLAKKLNLDVLHLFGFEGTMQLGAVLAMTGARIPLVVTLYGPLSRRRWVPAYRKLGAVVTATSSVKDQCEALGIETLQIRHGVVRLIDHPRSATPFRVLFWREATKAAGADLCTSTFARLAADYPQYSFDMALRRNRYELPEIQAVADRSPNINVLRFPYPAGISLDRLLAESICAVLPFRELTIQPQLAIAESLAAGVPTICSDLQSCAELVQSGINGFVVPVGDEAALSRAVKNILDHPEHALKMGADAKQRFFQDWNWDEYEQRIADVYRRLRATST